MMSICLSKSFNHAKTHAVHFNKVVSIKLLQRPKRIPRPRAGATNFFIQKPPTSLELYLKEYIMQHKACNTNTKFSEKMAATPPVAIGTRGTVGSLVRREIEYFNKFELQQCASIRKPHGQIVDIASSSGHSRNSFWFVIMRWKRKRRRGSSSCILPSICSAVEVADRNQLNGIPGFNYRILKNDVNNLHI